MPFPFLTHLNELRIAILLPTALGAVVLSCFCLARLVEAFEHRFLR